MSARVLERFDVGSCPCGGQIRAALVSKEPGTRLVRLKCVACRKALDMASPEAQPPLSPDWLLGFWWRQYPKS